MAIAIAALPLVWAVLFASGQLGFIERTTPERLAGQLIPLTGPATGRFRPVMPIVYAAMALIGAAVAVMDSRDRPAARGDLVVAWLAVSLVAPVLVSLFKPDIASRYFIVALPALVMLVGVGVAQVLARPLLATVLASTLVLAVLGRRAFALAVAAGIALAGIGRRLAFGMVPLGIGLVAAALFVATLGLRYRYTAPFQDWRATAAYVTSMAEPHDQLVAAPNSRYIPLRYYADQLPGGTVPTRLELSESTNATEVVRGLVADGGRLWIVIVDPGTATRARTVRFEDAVVASGFAIVAERTFGVIHVRLLAPP
jgi:hypothetical protein